MNKGNFPFKQDASRNGGKLKGGAPITAPRPTIQFDGKARGIEVGDGKNISTTQNKAVTTASRPTKHTMKCCGNPRVSNDS